MRLHARLFDSMRALLHAYLVGSNFLSEPTFACTAFIGHKIDLMCVRAAYALMRLCISTGSSEL